MPVPARRRPPSRARDRTRRLLLDAALRVFARKGAGGAALHEVAAEAGVSNGTFYNYFRSREDLVAAASLALAERLFEDITASMTGIDDPARRVAIGARRFVLKAIAEATWGRALLRVWATTPLLVDRTATPLLDDLRRGRRRRRLRYVSEAAAIDLVQGTVLAGMRTVLEGRAGAEHASDVAATILRGLGVDARAADALARQPLPEGGGGLPAAQNGHTRGMIRDDRSHISRLSGTPMRKKSVKR
ncbi:TetR/AcrR family transcriptional regulator [bacterium]|nr:TetR/AcrR family transcriptional regulator [bacterium]